MKYTKVFVLAMLVILIPLSCFAAKDVQSYDEYLAQKEELNKALDLSNQSKFSEALPIFKKLKDALNPAGEYYYAAGLYWGQGIRKDELAARELYNKVFPNIKSFAKKGDDVAQQIVARMYLEGWGTEKDASAAAKWCRKSAEQGNARAQAVLGVLYENGAGVEKNFEEADTWYRKAAAQGYSYGQYRLALILERSGNNKEYVDWYHKAAEQNDADSQYKLGEMYRMGSGVQEDQNIAVNWYCKAAKQGNYKASNMLANLYGVDDVAKAEKWMALGLTCSDMREWGSSYDPTMVKAWIARGLTPSDMQDWGPSYTPAEVKAWLKNGFSGSESSNCKQGGYSLKDIMGFLKSGAKLEDVKEVCRTISKENKLEWDKQFRWKEFFTWSRDFTFKVAAEWKNAGYKAEVAKQWINMGVDLPTKAVEWKNAGYTAGKAKQWINMGADSPTKAVEWENAGYPAEKAKQWINMGADSPAAATSLERECPKGFESIESLIQTNPYDVAGKCFDFVGETKQILSRSTALFTIAGQTFYLNFGKGSAPKMYFKGFAKGVGVYEYTTVLGAVQKVPHLTAIVQLK